MDTTSVSHHSVTEIIRFIRLAKDNSDNFTVDTAFLQSDGFLLLFFQLSLRS